MRAGGRMDEASIVRYITATFPDAPVATADGNSFFMYEHDRMMPFATLVTNNAYDQASGLDRTGVFRLNVGVKKETYRALFGDQPGPGDTDFTKLDQLMPHPVYAAQSWV